VSETEKPGGKTKCDNKKGTKEKNEIRPTNRGRKKGRGSSVVGGGKREQKGGKPGGGKRGPPPKNNKERNKTPSGGRV